MTTGSSKPPTALSSLDTEALIESLGSDVDLLLVGGQALNFWAERFSPLEPKLATAGPFTSKDIDFAGPTHLVKNVAAKLGGQARLPPPFDPSPMSGFVDYIDSEGTERTLDFLRVVYGLSDRDVDELAIPVDVPTAKGTASFRVLHPVLCLESRVHNVLNLPGYKNEHGLMQLEASVHCARCFIGELSANPDYLRAALKLSERIFRFTIFTPVGRRCLREVGIDPFDAVTPHPNFPAQFRSRRYPQMQEQLASRRGQEPPC